MEQKTNAVEPKAVARKYTNLTNKQRLQLVELDYYSQLSLQKAINYYANLKK